MMKRILFIVLCLVLAISAVPVLAAESAPSAPKHDGYLIALKEPLAPALAESSGRETVSDGLYYVDSLWGVGALSLMGEVDYWTTNDILSTQGSYDGYETELWNLQSVGASAAWRHTDAEGNRDRLGDGVTVAVVDSGVMANHPDLTNTHILYYVSLSDQSDGVDDYHGTFVTGLLAAEVNNGIGVDGIVPNVNILPICITWGGGKTDVKTAVAGIDKAVELGADVITFSIGGTNDNEALRQACQRAADQGVILVTCAGNYTAGRAKSAANYMYPAAYDCVVTVSACTREGDGVVFASDYSYFNDGVTVSAPGTDITSLYLDGSTATRTGTSFAAPIVTAMAAMAKQADRSIDTNGFTELLKSSSTDLGDPGFDPYYGYGYVNLPAFLEALDQKTGTVSPQPPAPGLGEYIDVPADAWFHDSVRWAAEQGLMNGTGAGAFSPNAPVSRAMVVTILWRMEGSPISNAALTFRDVPGQIWYAEAVRWAVASHIVEGYGPDRFGPNDSLTREQLAAILYRYAGAPDLIGMEASDPLDRFTDGSAVSAWARSAAAWAVGTGLLTGKDGGRLDPGGSASRAQTAAILMRFCQGADASGK